MEGLDGRERRMGDVQLPLHLQRKDADAGPELCIDADSTGNVARYINQCCQPNLFVQCVLSDHHDLKQQGFPGYYQLIGPIKQRYMQVGNAMVVPVARALGYCLASDTIYGEAHVLYAQIKISHKRSLNVDNLYMPTFQVEFCILFLVLILEKFNDRIIVGVELGLIC